MRIGVSFGLGGTTALHSRSPSSRGDPPWSIVTADRSPLMRARFLARSASPSTAPDATTAGPASHPADALDITSRGGGAADVAALAEGAVADASVRSVGATSFRPHPERL